MLQYTSILLMMFGLYGILTNRHLLKIIISLNVLEIGLNIFIITIAYNDGNVPIYNNSGLDFVDPLPHALVLTAIVIGVGTTALLLAYARKIFLQYGTLDLDKVGELS